MSILTKIRKQERLESILDSLKKLDYLTARQIQSIHDLKSRSNVSKILNDVEMKQYISVFQEGEKIYHLNSEGRKFVESDKVRKKSPQASHILMRNQVFIYYHCPESWKNEVTFNVEHSFKIKADAVFTHNGRKHILEVDRVQKMKVNEDKMKKYRDLAQLIYQKEKIPPLFVWVTTTEAKRKKLLDLCKKYGLAREVFIYSELTQLGGK